MWPAQRSSHSAFELVSASVIFDGVVADAGRPPHVRHRMRVARVVARIGPLGAEVHDVRDERLVERDDGAALDEVGDVDRDREADVVAATVVAELGVRLVGVGEEVVRHLDAVLLLEGRDDVLADVVGPVVDEQLGLGLGTGVGSAAAASLGGAAEPVGGGGALAALGDAVAPPPVQAATIGASAVTAPTLAIRSRSIRRVSLCSTM